MNYSTKKSICKPVCSIASVGEHFCHMSCYHNDSVPHILELVATYFGRCPDAFFAMVQLNKQMSVTLSDYSKFVDKTHVETHVRLLINWMNRSGTRKVRRLLDQSGWHTIIQRFSFTSGLNRTLCLIDSEVGTIFDRNKRVVGNVFNSPTRIFTKFRQVGDLEWIYIDKDRLESDEVLAEYQKLYYMSLHNRKKRLAPHNVKTLVVHR